MVRVKTEFIAPAPCRAGSSTARCRPIDCANGRWAPPLSQRRMRTALLGVPTSCDRVGESLEPRRTRAGRPTMKAKTTSLGPRMTGGDGRRRRRLECEGSVCPISVGLERFVTRARWPTSDLGKFAGWLYSPPSRTPSGWSPPRRIATCSEDSSASRWRRPSIRRRPGPALLHHFDQGSEYVALLFGQRCGRPALGVDRLTRPRSDNARALALKRLKAELSDRRSWPTKAALRLAVFEYVESFCDRHGRHSTLGYLSTESRRSPSRLTRRCRAPSRRVPEETGQDRPHPSDAPARPRSHRTRSPRAAPRGGVAREGSERPRNVLLRAGGGAQKRRTFGGS